MAKCPFHNDRNPSMKVDRRYYCFGCEETGDCIDLAGKLLGLSPYESALRIAEDFNINISNNKQWNNDNTKGENILIHPSRMNKKEVDDMGIGFMWDLAKSETQEPIDMKKWVVHTTRVLLRYRDELRKWKDMYKPDKADDDWHPKFVEPNMMLVKIDYWLDILLFDDEKDKELFYEDLKEEVDSIERRIKRRR